MKTLLTMTIFFSTCILSLLFGFSAMGDDISKLRERGLSQSDLSKFYGQPQGE